MIFNKANVTTPMNHSHNETLDCPMKENLLKILLMKGIITQNFEDWDFIKFIEMCDGEDYGSKISTNSMKG